jgi:hypothetical protein
VLDAPENLAGFPVEIASMFGIARSLATLGAPMFKSPEAIVDRQIAV